MDDFSALSVELTELDLERGRLLGALADVKRRILENKDRIRQVRRKIAEILLEDSDVTSET